MLAPLLIRIEELRSTGEAGFGTLRDNTRVVHLLVDLSRLTELVDGRLNPRGLPAAFNRELAEAFAISSRLILDDGTREELGPARKAELVHRAAALAVALAQDTGSDLVLEADGRRETLGGWLKTRLLAMKRLFEARDYNLTAFLQVKLRTLDGESFREHEDIRPQLANMTAVARAVERIIDEIKR